VWWIWLRDLLVGRNDESLNPFPPRVQWFITEMRILNLRRTNLSKGKEFPFLIFTITWVCPILLRDPNIPVTQIKASPFVSLVFSHQHFVKWYETGIYSTSRWIPNLIPFPVWEYHSIWKLWHSLGQLTAGSMWHWSFTKSHVIDCQCHKEYGSSHSDWFRHSTTSRRRLQSNMPLHW
jgi:hypothetical protein